MTTTIPTASFDLTADDYRAMRAHVCSPRKAFPRWVALIPAGLLGFVCFFAIGRSGAEPFLYGLLIGIWSFAIFAVWLSKRSATVFAPRPGGSILCSYTIELLDDGVRIETPTCTSLLRWKGILQAAETPKHIFFIIDNAAAIAVPKSAFPDAERAAAFVRFARERMTA